MTYPPSGQDERSALLNKWQKEAIRSAISVAADNLARAEFQLRRNPDWRSGNGDTILELIEQYRLHLRRLNGEVDD